MLPEDEYEHSKIVPRPLEVCIAYHGIAPIVKALTHVCGDIIHTV
jgi:hypothetical protein